MPHFLALKKRHFPAQDSLKILPVGAVWGLEVIRPRGLQTVGRFGLGLGREMAPLGTAVTVAPSPGSTCMYCGATGPGQWACGYLQGWATSPDPGSRARDLGWGAGGWTPDFPHSCLPSLPSPCPTSFSLCSMTLFVCLQTPGAEEAPMGRDWSRRMSAEGRLLALPASPHPQPLALGPFGHPSQTLDA